MSFTGTILAFEDEFVAWAERDVRRVEVPTGEDRLSLDELNATFATAHPGVKPTGMTVDVDPAAAIIFTIGRNEAYYLNPYTGEVRQPATTRMHDFMHTMVAWHRWLGREGDSRATGKAITGVSNAAFVVLAVTGLYLWWPRKWRIKGLKRSLWFMKSSTGKARDWNWHNVIGFWLLIPITIMAVTGMIISYRWAGNLIYHAVGEEPPVRRGSSDGRPNQGNRLTPPTIESIYQTAAGSAKPGDNVDTVKITPSLESIYQVAAADQPTWNSINLHLPVGATSTAQIKIPGTWPRTASTSLTITDGTVSERSDFDDLTTGRQLRTWSRFLHTGQALGWGGQLIAAIGCIGGCFLVYTGFALSWRRFFGRDASRGNSV